MGVQSTARTACTSVREVTGRRTATEKGDALGNLTSRAQQIPKAITHDSGAANRIQAGGAICTLLHRNARRQVAC